jgi:predicted nucleic acid-binding Zn ribbon protein
MEITYLENNDLAVFHGNKFRRDKKTGYYLNSNLHLRLHRAVWTAYHGEIPKGYHIHHLDGDKQNNDIENLVLIRGEEHSSYHGKKRDQEHHQEIVENLLTNAVPKAKAWHGSEAGKIWHSQHAKENYRKMEKREYHCLQCGKVFYKKPISKNKFCSNACKSAYRRKLGLDNIEKECAVCGKTFLNNKYSKQTVCSRECSNQLRRDKKHTSSRDRRCL